jgi:serine/threonine protein kinase
VVASYARQICLGLEYLHALNVVHADIKPANCLLDKSGLLKLSDFGCAQRLERHKHAHSTPPHSDPRACKASECFGQKGELGLEVVSSRAELDKLNDDELSDGASAAIGALVCVQGRAQMGRAIGKGQGSGIRYLMPEGTPNYMPPEVVRAREYSEKSDVWALGLSILECLTGLRGYPYTNPQTTLFQVGLGTAPDMPDWLGSEASSFIRACLQPNPRDRPTAAELLEHPFLLRSGCATLGPLGGGGRAGTDGRRDRQGARRAPPGVRAAEVPTALLQLLASLNAHTGGALQATSEAHRVCDDDKWVGSMVPIRGRSGEGRKATIEELESPTASRDGLRESGV